jgi:hypothetical protein
MFCRTCGNQIADESNFCPHCGMAVEEAVQVSRQDSIELPRPSDGPQPSGDADWVLWIFANYQAVLAAFIFIPQIVLLIIYTLEDFGVPKWVAATGLLLFPVVCFLVVRYSKRGDNMTSLALSDLKEDDPRSRRSLSSSSPLAPTDDIPRVIGERRDRN